MVHGKLRRDIRSRRRIAKCKPNEHDYLLCAGKEHDDQLCQCKLRRGDSYGECAAERADKSAGKSVDNLQRRFLDAIRYGGKRRRHGCLVFGKLRRHAGHLARQPDRDNDLLRQDKEQLDQLSKLNLRRRRDGYGCPGAGSAVECERRSSHDLRGRLVYSILCWRFGGRAEMVFGYLWRDLRWLGTEP